MATLLTLLDYIKSKISHHSTTLYNNSSFTLSLIKCFDQTTKSCIFDLLFNAPSIKSLQKNDLIKNSLKNLLKIQLIYKKNQNIFLNSDFRESFLTGIENRQICFFTQKNIKIKIDNFHFEDILKCLSNKQLFVNPLILEILIDSGLVDKNRDITNKGFEFLLKPRYEQYWFLVCHGLKYYCNQVNCVGGENKNVENFNRETREVTKINNSKFSNTKNKISLNQHSTLENNINAISNTIDQNLANTTTIDFEILNFISLMELSLLDTNTTYEMHSSLNTKFYTFLSTIGLISFNSPFIQPTNLPLLFTESVSLKNKFILVETNFKLYAYTISDYETSIIKLFADVYLTLPNLIKANLTEESVTNAFSKGVTANQIIYYLKTYSLFSELPITISNQIIIWEEKRNRIQMENGYMYSNFLNLVDYQNVVRFCIKYGGLIDKDDFKRILVVKNEFNEKVKGYIKSTMRK